MKPKMIATVEVYIHVRANREIRINPNRIDLTLLIHFNNIAKRWFKDNNIKIYNI